MIVIAATVAVALSGVITFGAPSNAEELKKVTVRLAFSYNGHRSPYLLGVDKGFYKEAGLDVEVLEGKGVTSSMQLVAAQQDTFAIIDPPSLMLGVAQGMPIKQVAQLYQTSPNALISWPEQNIKEPADLVGKKVATLQGDMTTTMLYALLAKNGIDSSKVQIIASDGGTRNQTFLAKRTEAITGFPNDSLLSLSDAAEVKLNHFTYASFGVDTMGDGIAAHTETVENSPEIVAAFVKATLRAYDYALQNPEESIDALLKRSPSRKKAVEVEKLKATAALLHAKGSEGDTVGFSVKERWEATQALMKEFGGLNTTVEDVTTYYTNDFIH
jgi:NitT/TauT family transport system substrate-binding protein